jgi:hypothetical protein
LKATQYFAKWDERKAEAAAQQAALAKWDEFYEIVKSMTEMSATAARKKTASQRLFEQPTATYLL